MSGLRAQAKLVVRDAFGNVLPGATVSVREPGTSTPISDTIYGDPRAGVVLTQPLRADALGRVEFWLTRPKRVDLLIESQGTRATSQIIRDVDVINPNLAGIVTPQEFGAKGDGLSDDTKAIQDAVDFVYNRRSPAERGWVLFPYGKYLINNTIYLGRGVGIIGQWGEVASIIRAGPNFPPGKGMIRTDRRPLGDNTIPHHVYIGNLALECASTADYAIEGADWQEPNGIFNLDISNFRISAINFNAPSDAAISGSIYNIGYAFNELAANAPSPLYGVRLQGNVGMIWGTHWSAGGASDVAPSNSAAVYITNGTLMLEAHHAERYESGVLVLGPTSVVCIGHLGHPSVQTLVRRQNGFVWGYGMVAAGSSFTLVDDLNGGRTTTSSAFQVPGGVYSWPDDAFQSPTWQLRAGPNQSAGVFEVLDPTGSPSFQAGMRGEARVYWQLACDTMTSTDPSGLKLNTQGVNKWTIYNKPDANNALRIYNGNGEIVMELTQTPISEATSLIIRKNIGGNIDIARVYVGAPDSGGTGYRVLRIPN